MSSRPKSTESRLVGAAPYLAAALSVGALILAAWALLAPPSDLPWRASVRLTTAERDELRKLNLKDRLEYRKSVAEANDASRQVALQASGFLVVIAGGIYAAGRYELSRAERKLAVEAHAVDRFAGAVGQLALDPTQQIAGIYALGKLAADNVEYVNPTVEVLTAFVRANTAAAGPRVAPPIVRYALRTPSFVYRIARRLRGKRTDELQAYAATSQWVSPLAARFVESQAARLPRPSLPVIEAVSLLVRLASADGLNLSGVALAGLALQDVDLRGWNFSGTSLRDASFQNVNFDGAQFFGADLTQATIQECSFVRADLGYTNFNIGLLISTDLTDATLVGASGSPMILGDVRMGPEEVLDGDAAKDRLRDLAGGALTP